MISGLLLPAAVLGPSDKLTSDEKIELLRGLNSEYAKVKVPLPRSKKPLDFSVDGKYDHKAWDNILQVDGAAARSGDQIQLTKISFDGNKLVVEINGGVKSGVKWYNRLEVGMGGNTRPLDSNVAAATTGTSIAVDFHKPLEGLTSEGVKKILAPLMDFDKHSAATMYNEQLPPEIQKAVKEKKAIVGMDKEQVLLAMGRPRLRPREVTPDGLETEDWIYGDAPGVITFVTFANGKVIKVKENYAAPGIETSMPR